MTDFIESESEDRVYELETRLQAAIEERDALRAALEPLGGRSAGDLASECQEAISAAGEAEKRRKEALAELARIQLRFEGAMEVFDRVLTKVLER